MNQPTDRPMLHIELTDDQRRQIKATFLETLTSQPRKGALFAQCFPEFGYIKIVFVDNTISAAILKITRPLFPAQED